MSATSSPPADPPPSGAEALARLAGDWSSLDWVPDVVDVGWAREALVAFTAMLTTQPAMLRAQQRKAERAAEQISPRAFQGVLEAIQNADDQHARHLRLYVQVVDGRRLRLLLVHDGHPALLHHVCAMVLPWLTTKDEDAEASGRFGIGQKTLQLLGGPVELHCRPFHVRLEGEDSTPCESLVPLPGVYDPAARETALMVPLAEHVDLDELHDEVSRFGAKGLLFLRHLRCLTLTVPGREPVHHELRHGIAETVELATGTASVRQLTDVRSGHRYLRYDQEVQVGPQEARRAKRTASATRVDVAVPLSSGELGHFHDRVPMPIATGFPAFVNAQFDPDPGRTFIAPNLPWNERRFDDLGRLLGAVALDLRSRQPQATWRALPLRAEGEYHDEGWLRDQFKRLTALAQEAFLDGVELRDGRGALDWVYESARLDGIVDGADQERLHPERVTMPKEERDRDGRWRLVLGELDGPEVITVRRALGLLQYHQVERDPSWLVRLAVAALDDELGAYLFTLPCVALRDGRRVVPPAPDEHRALVLRAEGASLGVKLGVVLPLAAAYLEPAAAALVDALAEDGRLVEDGQEGQPLLRLLARDSDAPVIEISDSDLVSVRDALERLPDEQRKVLGLAIGRNLALRGFEWVDGRREICWVAPFEAYLPRRIEKDSDALEQAARSTPGLLWVAEDYQALLRHAGGRQALGARRLLTLLGVETHPRLAPPENEKAKYKSDNRLGSRFRDRRGGAPRQIEAVNALSGGAHQRWLLDDRVSPDLEVIVEDIQADKDRKRSRERAMKLLAVLARGWDRRYAAHVEASAVLAYGGWSDFHDIPATWLANLAHAEWLPNGANHLAAPETLCLPTEENKRIYGSHRSAYVAKLNPNLSRSPALTALGVRPGPGVDELLGRLERLSAVGADLVEGQAIILHLATACQRSRRRQPIGDVPRRRFRAAFNKAPLIPSTSGWRARAEVLRGPAIFGSRRAFVESAPTLDALWDALELAGATTADCLQVLREVAEDGPLRSADRGVVMETMRRLAQELPDISPQRRTQLRRLKLWTGAAWTENRPLLACDDERFVAAVGPSVTFWDSGLKDLDDLGALLDVLGVERLRPEKLEPVAIGTAAVLDGEQHQRTFASAVAHLKEELARGDQALYDGLSVSWSALATARVLVEPDLRLALRAGGRTSVEVTVDAHVLVDSPLSVVVRSMDELGGEGLGRAIASLFRGDRQKLIWAWATMWRRATDGEASSEIALSSDAEAEPPAASVDLVDLQEEAAKRQATGRRPGSKKPATQRQAPVVMSVKDLSDYQADGGEVVNAGAVHGKVVFPSPNDGDAVRRRRAARSAGGDGAGGGTRTVPSSVSEREQTAFDAVERALRLDEGQLADLRARRGIGVDAVDQLRRFYEIKMSSGAMPDQVTLTRSELAAAQEEPDFFLAVVAGLADDGGELTVRFIFDPLTKLGTQITGDVTLVGVREVEALEYRFARTENAI
jgi:hypothetical protein